MIEGVVGGWWLVVDRRGANAPLVHAHASPELVGTMNDLDRTSLMIVTGKDILMTASFAWILLMPRCAPLGLQGGLVVHEQLQR